MNFSAQSFFWHIRQEVPSFFPCSILLLIFNLYSLCHRSFHVNVIFHVACLSNRCVSHFTCILFRSPSVGWFLVCLLISSSRVIRPFFFMAFPDSSLIVCLPPRTVVLESLMCPHCVSHTHQLLHEKVPSFSFCCLISLFRKF